VNLIEQLQTDVARHQRQLEERLAELKAEMVETRKVLTSVAKYRAKLGKQHPNGEAALPLVPPDDEEEEATDEVDDADAMHAAHPVVGALEPLVPEEWSPGYETPSPLSEDEMGPEEFDQAMAKEREPAPVEPEKPRRRKAKAAAEE
jgi:hypothetical protein